MTKSVNDPSRYCAFVGIDWADKSHDVCVQENGSAEFEHMTVEHSPVKLTTWILELAERFSYQPIAVAIETSKGPLVNFLSAYPFVTLFQVNPLSLSHYRKTFRVSSAKDDVNDAELLCELGATRLDRLRAIQDDDKQTKELGILCQQRRHIVEERKRTGNQLTANLKQYYPIALEVAGEEIHSNLACEFLLRFPTLEDLQAAPDEIITTFYKEHNCHRADVIEKRINLIRNAQPLTTDEVITTTSSMTSKLYARLLLAINEAIREHDKKISEKLSRHPDSHIFTSLPGAGDVLAPRLLSVFGIDRDKFSSSNDVQKFSGVAPIIRQSGQMKITSFRYACPKYIRQSFVEFAGRSTEYSMWANAFYQMQRDKGKSYQSAIRALAFRWIRIIYKCWKDNTPYDELAYLKSLQKRRSPIIGQLAKLA